ncbi:chymotrypsin-like elastase family member 2A [Watersipora subatra]|uniref:chymotrypsin-like elastase family member 2A n=1 Tax=Watersipora subatra TaxID=2589382 RepID=UPI00355BE2D5
MIFAAIWITCGVGDLNSSFDCGENKSIEAGFVCDGDEDCFWGSDESDDLCANHTHNSSGIWKKWLAKFLDDEYLKVGGCGLPDLLPKFRVRRLIDGEEAIRGSWPWQTALVKKDQSLVFCGGTLIHRQWVLTAGHCLESFAGNASNLELWFGRNDITVAEIGSQKRQASKIFRHVNHRYPAHKSNDIGLIKLAKPVATAPYVHLACLPTCVTSEPLEHCYLSGWGRVSEAEDDLMYPANLMQLKFPMVPHDLCRSEASWGSRITNKQVCAGGDGVHDMCWGDSGGGLHCSHEGKYTVYGVSSFTGHLCSRDMRPAIFSKVNRYLNWIGSTMGQEMIGKSKKISL